MDVHEGTATVREAMRFSAYLRQPYEVPESQKDADVEEIIELLELQPLADALVSSLGVEARKRLTIGVELASKPELLLFLDEPTSGLDGQSAWNIVRFLKKLADHGQAILCTIHQPSSLLFESFDRLLLLERGGETVSTSLETTARDVGLMLCCCTGLLRRHRSRLIRHPRVLRSSWRGMPRQYEPSRIHARRHRSRTDPSSRRSGLGRTVARIARIPRDSRRNRAHQG